MTEISKLRTIAFVSHSGAGKTTLAESILFLTKVTNRLGRVGDGTSILDFEPEETKRSISISAAFHSFPWKKHEVHFVDTPGDENFLNDTRTTLQGVDGAVVLIDAVDGIKVGTEKVWAFTDEYELPRLVVVNKLDRERADFAACVKQLQDTFGSPACMPVQLPIGAENDFKGLVDLLDMKAYLYEEGTGKFTPGDIPEDLADEAAEMREKVVEAIAEADDALLEKYFEAGELSPEELDQGLITAVRTRRLSPVLCAAGSKLIGLPHLLDKIVDRLPSPVDRGPVKCTNAKGDQEMTVDPDPAAPFAGLVIKSITDPYAGQLSIIRVFAGSAKPDTSVLNVTKDSKERFGQLLTLEGKAQKPIEGGGPGAIVAVAKLKDTKTGDTLCEDARQVRFPGSQPLPPVISYAVFPKTKGDEEKVFAAINKIREEDVTLRLARNDQTREMVLSGMGQVHIDATVEKIRRKFGAEMELKIPKVAYKEAIKGKTRMHHRHKKQTGGKGQFGDVHIEMEPMPRGEGFVFDDKIVGGVIPRQFIPAVEKGIVEALASGVISGNPVVDVRVALVDGGFHPVDSSEMAFKIAGSMAFKKGMLECKPVLLEPVMKLQITVPDDFMGDVIGDLNSRRGKVLGMDSAGGKQVIRAMVPQVEVLQYAPTLTSMTGGRGAFTIEFDHYDEVPSHLQEKIIADFKADVEE